MISDYLFAKCFLKYVESIFVNFFNNLKTQEGKRKCCYFTKYNVLKIILICQKWWELKKMKKAGRIRMWRLQVGRFDLFQIILLYSLKHGEIHIFKYKKRIQTSIQSFDWASCFWWRRVAHTVRVGCDPASCRKTV